jgi:TRAP-type mannitol/chloroaromatic compound transport system permease small subunit
MTVRLRSEVLMAQTYERTSGASVPVALIYSRLSRRDQAEEGASLHH